MNKYSSNLPFLDMLFNTLLCFVGLFALASMLISAEKLKKNIDMKAVYLITVTWPDGNTDDVDTYVEDPMGKLVFFRRREQGLMHLDRDDLGHKNDTIQTQFGRIEFKGNREIVTLRGIIPGEYTVNVHMFAYREDDGHETPVTVSLTRIEPFSVVTQRKVTLYEDGDEKTAFRFTLDKEGNVTDKNELEVSLIGQHMEEAEYEYDGEEGYEQWER